MHIFRFLLLILVQSVTLTAGQVMLRLALQRIGVVSFTWGFIHAQLLNFWWLGCGIAFLLAGLLWMYILKHYPFSIAYPMASVCYVFGMIAAVFVFHEQVSFTQWLGVLLIMGGCFLIAR